MAPKKAKSSKKLVTLTIRPDALHRLKDAVEAVSALAGAFELAEGSTRRARR